MIIFTWFVASLFLLGAYFNLMLVNTDVIPPLMVQGILFLAIVAMMMATNEAIKNPDGEEDDWFTEKVRSGVGRIKQRRGRYGRAWYNR